MEKYNYTGELCLHPFFESQWIDFNQNKHLCIWKIRKLVGGNEMMLGAKFTLQENTPAKSRKELGPITLSFEIPSFNISNMRIEQLHIISNDVEYNPKKWIRNFTKSKSSIFIV